MNQKASKRVNLWTNAMPRVAGATAIVTGAIVLIGWILDVPVLKSLHPSLVSMKVNAALAFVLSGMSFLLYAESGPGRQRMAARILATMVLLIGLITVAEYVFTWDAGIDQLLFKEPQGTIGTFSPGRMAFSSAMSFCLFGLSLLMLKRRNQWSDGATQVLALMVCVLGLLALVAYMYGLHGSSGFAVYTRMALHTSCAFILLSLGVICLQPNVGIMAVIRGEGSGGFMARRLMVAAVGMPLVLGWVVARGEMMELYGPQFGDVIDATAYVAILVILIWMVGRALEKADSERRNAEKALRESEERYRLTVENATDLIYNIDPQGSVTSANAATSRLLGYSLDDIVGRRYLDFVRPDFRKRTERNFMTQWLRKTPSVYFEAPVLTKDGRELWFGQNVTLVYKNEDAVGFLSLSRDITARRRAEKLNEALYSISQAIHSTNSLNELFGLVHRAISSIVAANNFYIALLTNDGKRFYFPYERDENSTDESTTIDVHDSQSLTSEVFNLKRPLLLNDKELQDRYSSGRNRVWGTQAKCWLGVPLMMGNEAIGVMAVQDYSRGDTYGQKDVELLELAAGQIAIAVERKRAEESLKQSVSLLQATLESTADGILVVDQSGRIERYNKEFAKMWMIPDDTVESRDDDRALNLVVGQLKDPEAFISKVRYLYDHPEESSFDVLGFTDSRIFECYSLPQRVDGKPVGRVWSFRDVTERLRAEKAVKASELELRRVWEGSFDGMRLVDGQGTILLVNEAYCTMIGKRREELVGKPLSIITVESGQRQMLEKHKQRFSSGTIQPRTEKELELWDGRRLWFEVSNSYIESEGQPRRALGIFRDVTKRKRAEEALAAERLLLRTFIDNVPDTIYVKDAACRKTLANPVDVRNMGASSEAEVLGKTDFDFYPHEVAGAFYADDQSVIQSGRPILNREEMITLPDKAIGWLLTSKVPLRDSTGQVIGLVGIGHDITEHKRAEQEREFLINELKTALENVRTLDGLVPICAHCKKIRDDKGYWNQLEKYLGEHTDAKLTHGLCPDCAKLYFPGIAVTGSGEERKGETGRG